MRWLLFLSRLAFICGLFTALSLSLQFRDWLHDEVTVSTIVTIGYFMGMIILPLTTLSYGIVYLVKHKLGVPRWLVIMNILFFLLLIFILFYLNDPYYHQK
jgi:hypothetical protein